MTKTLESKLNEFFTEHDIEKEEVKAALRKVFDTTCETAFLFSGLMVHGERIFFTYLTTFKGL